ncbi:MAG TPA: protein translocase subunit SecF [Egibacteraceae bacterium]|nr:protein translocase subunit SecF [Egibacteraceae bacterium]
MTANDPEAVEIPASPSRRRGGLSRLLNGQSNIDFIGRSRLWLFVSIALVAVAVAGLASRQLNLGIDFTGGTAFTVADATQEFDSADLRGALADAGVSEVVAQVLDDGQGALVTTSALEEFGTQRQSQIIDRLAAVTGSNPESIDVSQVGPRWGAHISRQALIALAVFLILVVAYITIRFELRMAAAALVTLVHDVVVTVGIYAVSGFEISPSSVIALLTILGYSLYDTLVVFDRVDEDTQRLSSVSTSTYGESANRALNEVLMRSLSTSATSLLPVGSLLFIGATLLGADTLQDLALALFIGMAVGTYSSIFVATPMLVWLKEREPRYAELKERLSSRRGAAAS